MYVQDFVIPLNREDLLEKADGGQYYVRVEYEAEEIREKLEAARTALAEEGTDFIVDHFPAFFSLLQKFKQCPQIAREKGWTTVRKGFALLSRNLQVLLEDTSNLDSEIQSKMCNITKMIIYILIEMMKLYQDMYVVQNSRCMDGKVKKKQVKVSDDEWDWNSEKHSILSEIFTFLQLPFKFLWEPPVVDEEFTNLIANFCYNCLEDPGIGNSNSKALRETIFQILGVLIRNYLHGLSFCVKVVQLLKMNDHLVNILAQGIVHLHQVCNCKNIVKEIVREVADTDGDQLAADTAGTRNLNLFLVQLAESIPEAIVSAIDLLISHLSGDSYSMRICVVGVLGEIVLNILTKEDLDENMKKMRDDYLDCLEEHIHDVNAFVRTRVLNIWQKLCVGKAIPISRLTRLLELVIGRLNDKSTNVKKQSVHLIKDMLEGNPFCGQLNMSEIKSQLEQEKKKLEAIETTYNLKDSDEEWKEMEKKLKDQLEEIEEEDDDDDDDVDKKSDDENGAAGSEEEIINMVGNYLCDGKYKKAIDSLLSLKNEFYKVYNIKKETLSQKTLIEILQKIFNAKKKVLMMNVPPETQEKIEKLKVTIDYLENALEFTELIDRALPIILTFLDSNVVTDVLEAIRFFTAAYLFGFSKASEGVKKMLYLIFSKEANIKSAVSSAYQDLYFQTNGNGRQQSLATVKNLGELVLKLNFSQLDALEEVVKQWVKDEVIDKNCVQVMFERFSMKIAGTGNDQSWAALVLIRMVGAQEPKIIKNNITILLNEGLKKQGSKSFLVAKETCKALNYMLPPKEQGKPFDHTLRLPRDHEMFRIIHNLLKIGIWRVNDPYYVPMADEAVNLVFATCDRPDEFCKDLIVEIHEAILSGKRPVQKKNPTSGNMLNRNTSDLFLGDPETESATNSEDNLVAEEEEEEMEKNPNVLHSSLLTRFISILGQVASNYILFLEGPVLDELKLRNQLEYERKLKKIEEKKSNTSIRRNKKKFNDSEGDKTLNESGIEYLDFQRGTADDMDAEEMKRKTENKIVTGDGFLAKFAPLILKICKNPGKYNNRALQNAALLALSKFMQVSSVFCEENLQLLVTICEKSQIPERQENAMIALGALQYRFPSTLEPWTPHMCGMLQSSNPSVRYSSILILTDLFVNEMIKVRHHVSDLATCIVDKDIKIARVARHFFREYSQKGNSLYNVLPSLISNLTQTNAPLPQDEFKTVMKFILGLVTKEKQSEYLVEKLFQYFESATTERQWCDLAYCLSLLSYNDKGLKKILENVRYFGNKLYLAEVYEAFCTIVADASKNPQKDKAIIGELDALIKECRGKTCENKNESIGPVLKKTGPPPSTRKKVTRRKYLPSDSEEEFEKSMTLRKRKTGQDIQSDAKEGIEDEEDALQSDASTRRALRSRAVGNKENTICNSDSDEAAKKESVKGSVRKKSRTKQRKPKYSSEDEDIEEDTVKTRSTRSCRKRRCQFT